MNILYLHGLDSSLNNEKRTILEKYGTVYAPAMDYRNNKKSIESVVERFIKKDINAVIGSSLGGFAGFYLSDVFQRPALLFNPALAYRSVPQEIPNIGTPRTNLKHIVLGAKDETIDPKTTLEFLAKSIGNIDYNIKIRQDLEHRIPEEIFREEIKAFFKKLCY